MLPEERRVQLDGIVEQMLKNKESDDYIQSVVNDFKLKYDKPTVSQKSGTLDTIKSISEGSRQGAKDFVLGQLKGAGTSALNIASLGSNILKSGYDATIGKMTGKKAVDTKQTIEAGKSAIAPTNLAQKIGFGTEQIGEMFIPTGIESGVTKLASGKKYLTSASKVLGGTADIAGKTYLQTGGDNKQTLTAAALTAGGLGLGEAASALSRKLSPALKASAEKSYAQALGATTKENKAITQKIVPQLIEKKVTGLSRKALASKFSKELEVAGKAMDDVLDTIPKDAPVSLKSVIDQLDDAKMAFMVPGKEGTLIAADPQAVKHIEGFQAILKDVGIDDAPYESVRKLRQIWDNGVAQSKGFYGKTLAEGSKIEAQREATNAIRAELAREFPNMDKVNREFSFWSKANKVINDTLERTQSQQRPLTETIRRSAGAVGGASIGGPVGGVLGDIAMSSLTKLVDSTLWRTTSAIQKNSLANYLAKGDLKKAIDLMTRVAVGAKTEK